MTQRRSRCRFRRWALARPYWWSTTNRPCGCSSSKSFRRRGTSPSNGPSGLKILQSEARVDLLITDVGLPGGLNGRQVADAARLTRPDLKVLFVTGFAENAAVGNGHLEPGMEVITKPFAMAELANKITDMIESRRPDI